MTLYARALAALLLAVALAAGWHTLTSHYEDKGYQRAKDEDRVAMEKQAATNRDLQRAAEKRYVVQQGVRDRFIVQTVKEIHELASPLADCRVPPALVLRLNEARSCAIGDPGSPCGPDGAMPTP